MKTHRLLVVPAILALTASGATAQTGMRIEVTPASMTLSVGDTASVTARVIDASGNAVDAPLLFFSSSRRRLDVDRETGRVEAIKGGEYTINVRVLTNRDVRVEIPVSVAYPPVSDVAFDAPGERFYVGAAVRHVATVRDQADDERPDVRLAWSTDDPTIASVDRHGVLTAHRTGAVTLTATAQGVTRSHEYRVVENPVRTLTLSATQDSGRTGDVIRFTGRALDSRGQVVDDVPMQFSLVADPEDSTRTQFPAAEIDQQGRFVANQAGVYTVLATAPGHIARHTVEISRRHVTQEVEFIGHGAVREVNTSDLWIWEGVDGRDYAVTGTHSAHGVAYFWDVTDPASIVMVDSVKVDARTVNDVKISEDGRIAVISREGASNRRNGLVILDVSNPRDVQVISRYDEELTGGVHNVFISNNHIFAVNNGRRYDIINIEDPTNPHRVGRFELDTPGHGVHDVWVVDGIAYSSNWADGVVLVDVGNGVAGGSPAHPVQFAQYRDYTGRNHAAFPYQSPTGRFYIIMGDEMGAPSFDGEPDNAPQRMSGYFHVVDFTDPLNPEEVARFDVPEAGSHNLWIEDDRLYVAYYNGGVRVVDISGELKGNLYYQGREVARYKAYDPNGVVANAPFSWGPQPYKGHLFFAEYNSGLWAVKLLPRDQVLTP
jgi:hypothetical protein